MNKKYILGLEIVKIAKIYQRKDVNISKHIMLFKRRNLIYTQNVLEKSRKQKE